MTKEELKKVEEAIEKEDFELWRKIMSESLTDEDRAYLARCGIV